MEGNAARQASWWQWGITGWTNGALQPRVSSFQGQPANPPAVNSSLRGSKEEMPSPSPAKLLSYPNDDDEQHQFDNAAPASAIVQEKMPAGVFSRLQISQLEDAIRNGKESVKVDGRPRLVPLNGQNGTLPFFDKPDAPFRVARGKDLESALPLMPWYVEGHSIMIKDVEDFFSDKPVATTEPEWERLLRQLKLYLGCRNDTNADAYVNVLVSSGELAKMNVPPRSPSMFYGAGSQATEPYFQQPQAVASTVFERAPPVAGAANEQPTVFTPAPTAPPFAAPNTAPPLAQTQLFSGANDQPGVLSPPPPSSAGAFTAPAPPTPTPAPPPYAAPNTAPPFASAAFGGPNGQPANAAPTGMFSAEQYFQGLASERGAMVDKLFGVLESSSKNHGEAVKMLSQAQKESSTMLSQGIAGGHKQMAASQKQMAAAYAAGQQQVMAGHQQVLAAVEPLAAGQATTHEVLKLLAAGQRDLMTNQAEGFKQTRTDTAQGFNLMGTVMKDGFGATIPKKHETTELLKAAALLSPPYDDSEEEDFMTRKPSGKKRRSGAAPKASGKKRRSITAFAQDDDEAEVTEPSAKKSRSTKAARSAKS